MGGGGGKLCGGVVHRAVQCTTKFHLNYLLYSLFFVFSQYNTGVLLRLCVCAVESSGKRASFVEEYRQVYLFICCACDAKV